MSRKRLDTWGSAFFALIGLAACGGVSVDQSNGGAGATGGTAGSAGSGNAGITTSDEHAGPCTAHEDCSPGKRCVEYSDSRGYIPCTSGLVCETSLDECASYQDCSGGFACMPDANWVRRCVQPDFCAIGRPFLVDGAARTAPVTERADWLAREALSAADPGDDALREALYEHWLLAGRMEHASVAAFARFGLELLALGAPSDLVLEAAAAMKDETIHAELCFGLASRYGEAAVGPGPLEVDRALERTTLAAALENALLEGCIGETLAAAEAQAAIERASDPVVREVLERVAADETRHAALAFRFVRWALEQGAPGSSELVRRTLDAQLELGAEAPADAAPAAALLAAGVLPARHRAEVRRYAYETIVRRALRALLNEPEATTYPAVASC